jgi:hypothetical protein
MQVTETLRHREKTLLDAASEFDKLFDATSTLLRTFQFLHHPTASYRMPFFRVLCLFGGVS